MPIRNRNGKLEWRFKIDGHAYSHITDLDDTPRNRIKAHRLEAEARQLVTAGRGAELRIKAEPFSSAAGSFAIWADGEYSDHPNSAKRLRVSMTSAKVFFGKRPLSSITRGDLEDFKSWRRSVHKVREVTLRHDLHALSVLFQYGIKHNWCRGNPVEDVDIPSDKDAVRINVLTPAMEARYFAALDALLIEKTAGKRTREMRGLVDMRDLHMLMLRQGCRPEELRELEHARVDLERGRFYVSGKSEAAKRWLKMRSETRDILVRRMATPGRWVFPSKKNPGQHIGQAQRLHAAVLLRAGLQCVPYDFRHTFATRAMESGLMDITTLAQILGHANLRSVMKYVHLSQSHMDAALLKLDSLAHKPSILGQAELLKN